MKAARFIARVRRDVRRMVAAWTGEYQYTIDQVLENMIKRANELNLRLTAPEERDQARLHDHAHRADDELPAQRPASGRAVDPDAWLTRDGHSPARFSRSRPRYDIRHALARPFQSRRHARPHPCRARRLAVRRPRPRRATVRADGLHRLARRLSRAGRPADRRVAGVAVRLAAAGADRRHLRPPAERLEGARGRDRLGGRGDEEGRPRERAHRAGEGAALGARPGERRDRRAAPSTRW